MPRLHASYLSPVRKPNGGPVESYPIVRYEERSLFPVLKTGFDSGAGYAYVYQGDQITRIEGGFFGKHVHYTVVGVEIEQRTPNSPRFPVFVVKDDYGDEIRLDHRGDMRVCCLAE